MSPKLYISQNSNTEKFVQFFLAPFAIPQFSGVSLCEEKNLCVLTPAVMSYLFSYTYFSSINVMYGTYNTNYNRPEEGSDKTGTLSICPLYGFLIPSPRLSPPARGGGKEEGGGKEDRGLVVQRMTRRKSKSICELTSACVLGPETGIGWQLTGIFLISSTNRRAFPPILCHSHCVPSEK